ncbi:peptidoglycan-binding domain-containing protein [Roseibium sp.]|uniref:peptidoglycan-binding domain-containing protein n=3 Tax=Roseibium sp. TaxID=1936156 RepID=UPI00326525FD
MARGKKADFEEETDGMMARAGGIARDNPVAAGGAVVMALTGCLIVANAVSLQPGRHPAPFFATRDRPQAIEPDDRRGIVVQEVSALVLDLQTSLRRIGIYEGPLDGLMGPATERSIRHYERLHGRLETGEATDELLALITLQGAVVAASGPPVPRPKPIGASALAAKTVSAPPLEPENPRLARIQQLLSDLGYGPLSTDGVMGDNTSSAIQRFELDRGLPITGELTPAVVERLEMVSGKRVD